MDFGKRLSKPGPCLSVCLSVPLVVAFLLGFVHDASFAVWPREGNATEPLSRPQARRTQKYTSEHGHIDGYERHLRDEDGEHAGHRKSA